MCVSLTLSHLQFLPAPQLFILLFSLRPTFSPSLPHISFWYIPCVSSSFPSFHFSFSHSLSHLLPCILQAHHDTCFVWCYQKWSTFFPWERCNETLRRRSKDRETGVGWEIGQSNIKKKGGGGGRMVPVRKAQLKMCSSWPAEDCNADKPEYSQCIVYSV